LVHPIRDPNTKEGIRMKPEIHPEYKETQVTCGCGEKFVTRSTVASGSIYVEVVLYATRSTPASSASLILVVA